MNFHRRPTILFAVLLATWTLLGSTLEAKVNSRLSSRFLARGERALLEVAFVGKRPTAFPEIAPVEGVKIVSTGSGPQTQYVPGRRVEHTFSYVVSSYEVGEHRIPAIQVKVGDEIHTTEPLSFSVFNPDELTWSKARAGDTEFRYASAFKVLNDQPFVDQSIPVEIKLFVPRDLFVIDWGIPDFGRDGLTAWRMQPREMRSSINLLGMPYISIAYPSTLTPNRSGEIAIGPASVRLISTQVVMDGILKRKAFETQIQVPELKLEARALPDNAPTGFQNAVGKFKIQVTTAETEVNEGDPIPVDIVVSGSGNLDTLQAPHPLSPLGWKAYEPTRQQRGDERRELAGSVSFQQFMRPLEMKGNLPSYRLVFFNPETESYESVQTEPITLQMTPALGSTTGPVGPPKPPGTPVEQMTDILGLIPNASLTGGKSPVIPQWWIHGLGTLLAFGLILRAIWLHRGKVIKSDPRRRDQLRELKQIESVQDDDHQFLMAVGRFIERWLGRQPSAEIRQILEERDANCFRNPDERETSVGPQRRKDILNTLRNSTSSCLLIASCLLLGAASLRAQEADQTARQAYESARYDRAIETWLQAAPYDELSADTLYHVGNASYRAGSPGHAALYYRRALARDAQHLEARQNLRFIERKYGSLSIQRPDHQYLLARLPLEFWQSLTWSGLWLCAIGLLCFPASRRGARLRQIAVFAIIVSPLFSVSGGLGWRYFPADAAFAPLERQAVIINSRSKLHSEASRNSSVVIETPPGSLCEVLYQSGDWSYVSFATQTRGWLPSANIEHITPEETPEVPQISKPVADETSA